jgi:hypothetical protein
MQSPTLSRLSLALLMLSPLASACSGDSTAPTANVTVTVEPASVELVPGQIHQFTASVAGTNINAVNWTATGGTITSGGFYTAGSEPGSYAVTATSAVSQQAHGEAVVFVREAGLVIPIWNRSDASAGAAQNSQQAKADSADFSGFEATLFAASSTGSASTGITATFHRQTDTGHLNQIDSESFTNVNNTMPPDGTPSAHNRVRLVFEVRNAAVGYTFTAQCTFWGFDAQLRRTSNPTKKYFSYDIMDGEFDDGECEAIEHSDILQPGTYELEVTHTFNTPWDLEPGTTVVREGGYTMRLEFDQAPEL